MRLTGKPEDWAKQLDEPRKCPTCDSPAKHLHPAMQHEGEVQPCLNPWHEPHGSILDAKPTYQSVLADLTAAQERIQLLEGAIIAPIVEAWPDIRQLIDGWKSGTPADEWSEWDEKVRQKTITISFLIAPLMEMDLNSRAPGPNSNDLLNKSKREVRDTIIAETGKCPDCLRESIFCRCNAVHKTLHGNWRDK